MGLLSYFQKVVESSDRMDRMMKTLHVEDSFADLPNGGQVLRRASQRCMGCKEPGACEEWLKSHDDESEAPAYCRNHDLFVRLNDQIESKTA